MTSDPTQEAPPGVQSYPGSPPQDVPPGSGDLSWLVNEVRSGNAILQQATGQLADLSRRMNALERVDRHAGSPIEDSEDVRRRLAWLAAEIAARSDVLTTAADEVDRIGAEMSALRGHTTDQVANLQARIRQVEVSQGPVGLRHELDRVAAEVSGVPDFAELGRAALRTMEIEASVASLRQDVERITRGLSGLQQSAMAHVSGRIAPLEGAIHELRQELATAVQESAAARAESNTQMAESLAVLSERVVGVEMLPADIDSIRLAVDGLSARHTEWSEAAAAAMQARFDEVESRIAALAALTADVEGLYRELDRGAERSAAQDGALQAMAERSAPIEAGLNELRQTVDALVIEMLPNQQVTVADMGERVQLLADRISALGLLAGEVRDLQVTLGSVGEEATASHQAALATATEQLAIGARLRELDAVPAEIEGIYRELDRVTGETTTIRESVLGAVFDRLAPMENGLGQLRFDLDAMAEVVSERFGEVLGRLGAVESLVEPLVEKLNEMAGRLVPLEPIPAEFEGLHRELDRVVTDAFVLREQVVDDTAAKIAPVADEVERLSSATRQALVEVEARLAAIDALDHGTSRIEALVVEVEALRAQVEAQRDILGSRVGELEVLPTEVSGLYREMGRISEAVSAQEQSVASTVASVTGVEEMVLGLRDRIGVLNDSGLGEEAVIKRISESTEPVEASVGQLAAQVDAVMAELRQARAEAASAAESAAPLADGVESLRADVERLLALEAVPGQVEAMAGEVDTVLRRLTSRQQADLAAASAQVQDLEARLVAIEAIPADMDGLYSALYGVAATLKKLGAENSEPMPVAPKLVGTRRVPTRKPKE